MRLQLWVSHSKLRKVELLKIKIKITQLHTNKYWAIQGVTFTCCRRRTLFLRAPVARAADYLNAVEQLASNYGNFHKC